MYLPKQSNQPSPSELLRVFPLPTARLQQAEWLASYGAGIQLSCSLSEQPDSLGAVDSAVTASLLLKSLEWVALASCALQRGKGVEKKAHMGLAAPFGFSLSLVGRAGRSHSKSTEPVEIFSTFPSLL